MANNFRNGQVKIANEILDQLAIRASEEINGVCGQEENDSKLNISQHGPKSTVTHSNGKLLIDLSVNLDKNVNVRKTVKNIQENVVRVIESMTGLSVSRVNVSVDKLVI
ncbi:Asp23/Gls24 family envelope stress response protein [Anaerococcus sp. mt242]|uniref:Asp23/Gls24 family envelope stress response protein n=1 Tax=Anaerococcus sp. mt242 TaxID=2661917 RepID=UPI0019345C9D|nr:Asp23/Gls24 family envelope stress response protein [Anaerococcus sp. mt242]MBM0046363.1 Asp23/Gls24 family envelope stress response protein [Anaerococcus sp. mt242]